MMSAALYGVAPGRRHRRIAIAGTEGRLEIDDERATLVCTSGREHVAFESNGVGPAGDFVAALRGERPVGCTVPEAIAVVRAIDAAYRAAATGSTVQVLDA